MIYPESNIAEDTVVILPPYPLDPRPINDDQNDVAPENPINDGTDRPNPAINDGNAQMPETRYPKCDRSKPKYLEHYIDGSEIDETNHVNCTVNYRYIMSELPQSYQKAISSPRSRELQKAMEEEMHALRENDTFELTKTKMQLRVDWYMLSRLVQMGRRNVRHVL